MVGKKEKPKFNVMNLGFMTGIKARWRRPRGTNNAKRMRFEWAGKSPRVGYKNAPEVRGLHPLGLPEIIVNNVAQLRDAAGHVVRIAAQVGTKKALEIEKAAAAAKLVVVNPRKAAPKEKAEGKAKAENAREAKAPKPEPKREEKKSPAGAAKAPPESPQPPAPQMKGGKR